MLQPIVPVHAAKFRIEERTFEVDAEAASARNGPFRELMRGLGNFVCSVQHRLPGSRHDRCDETRRTARGVRTRRDFDGVALIAVE